MKVDGKSPAPPPRPQFWFSHPLYLPICSAWCDIFSSPQGLHDTADTSDCPSAEGGQECIAAHERGSPDPELRRTVLGAPSSLSVCFGGHAPHLKEATWALLYMSVASGEDTQRANVATGWADSHAKHTREISLQSKCQAW